MKPGHSKPRSNESTVPDTAPTANSTAVPFAQRRARSRYARSPVRRHRHSASTIRSGMAIPISAKMMWKPSDIAIWVRAARRSVTSTRSVLERHGDQSRTSQRDAWSAPAFGVVNLPLAVGHVHEAVAHHRADGRLGRERRLLVEYRRRHDAVAWCVQPEADDARRRDTVLHRHDRSAMQYDA